ncbi:MAG: hypothetical protein JSS02_20290 [Planctomycetes bacterium]|nr:hypothetical protein [Planctomycetota bacterium]
MNDSLLEALRGREVIIDAASPYVILGTLVKFDDTHLLLDDADVHDLRDTTTTRENYIVDSRRFGIRVNRERTVVRVAEIVCISALEDVVL